MTFSPRPPAVNAQEELTDSAYNSPVEKTYDSEKFAFPSNDDPVPTYSVTFGSGQEVPPPSQMRFSPPRSLGPRFYSGTTLSSDFNSGGSNPFVTPTNTEPSVRSLQSPSPTLSRQTSRSSQRSTSSTNSAGSQNSAGSGRGRRWVIE